MSDMDISILLKECAYLLEISGINSKQIVSDKLKEIISVLEGDNDGKPKKTNLFDYD